MLDRNTAGAQTVTFTVAATNTYNLGGLKGADDLDIGTNTVSVGANNQSTVPEPGSVGLLLTGALGLLGRRRRNA